MAAQGRTMRIPGFAGRVGLAWTLFCAPASAQTAATTAAAPDKNGYTLFDPTPDALMRPLQTDRPGKSYSPFTVDAGHVQVESDFWLYRFDHWTSDSSTTRSTTILDPNLKLGLTDRIELDAILPLHTTQVTRSRIGQGRQSGQGVGDLQLGGKINCLGNDGDGSHGLGVFLAAELPTGAAGTGDERVNYTLELPVVLPLPDQFSITLEPGFALLENAVEHGYHGDAQFVVNLNRQIPHTPVTAAVELALDSQADHNTGDQDTIDGSLQWPIGKGLQLDVGVYVGLDRSATDWSPYTGFSARF